MDELMITAKRPPRRQRDVTNRVALFHDCSGLRFGCVEVHGTADNPASCTATTSMFSEPVTSPVDAGAVTVKASSMRVGMRGL